MQMISQKKSIFKNSHRQENGNANLDRTPKKSQYITFSPLKNPQKENITTNSRN